MTSSGWNSSWEMLGVQAVEHHDAEPEHDSLGNIQPNATSSQTFKSLVILSNQVVLANAVNILYGL